ncbi:MAG TPA: M23 family metallopeptidase [Vicinamibacterales bacterium]|nr:M23 family metallopeptidase [Vicinamibacterales bacterium]
MFRWLALVLVLVVALVGGSYIAAGYTAPPTVVIDQPAGPIGQRGTLQFTAIAPRGFFTRLEATLAQNGTVVPIFNQDAVPEGATLKHLDADHVQVTRPIGKTALPTLQQGPATITVTAVRTSFLRLRDVTTTVSKDIQVRLEPPRIAVLSTKHYLNHGGSEFVVYRATPPDVESGVRVGEVEYRGYPAAGAGVPAADPALKVAFFALLHDQPLTAPVVAFARDGAGNEAHVSFVDDVFDKAFRKSRIAVDDRFLGRVVPEILSHSPQVKVDDPNDLLAGFLKVNGELRRLNADQILALGRNSLGELLWKGPFTQLGNSQVEAAFADARTYVYNGKDVDQQTHLGFDLAVTANVPVLAANSGRVVNADWLGIYGNCVVIDHGLGVASLYGHLSSIDVKTGDTVSKGQVLGRSGMTGMAGGDHLHFTMLVGGHPVNPVEWWDPHWIQDRVERKLVEAGAAAPAPPAAH